MIGPDLFTRVTAEAVVPEQVVSYVRSAGGGKPRMFGSCVGFELEGELVLVGYPLHDPLDLRAMDAAVNQALETSGLARVTAIGPARPKAAPDDRPSVEDWYYALPVPPPPPGQKLRNLLRRASRELVLERGNRCGDDHMAMVQGYLNGRTLTPGARQIFARLPRYLEGSPGSLLLSARQRDGRLAAFAVGEFAALRTAFYMFCFRDPGLAPPGSADLLLSGLFDEALRRGQTQMNLGLGVDEGIRFFKRKWGALPFLPYIQVSWEPTSVGLLSRLFGAFGR